MINDDEICIQRDNECIYSILIYKGKMLTERIDIE